MHIQEIIVQLLLKQPFYGYIASSITPVGCSDILSTKMITDPSLKLMYNREWFEKLSEKHALGVVIHEILHLIFMHPFRKGNRNKNFWIAACDMAVNEYIDDALLPVDSITVRKIAGEFKIKIPSLKSAEFYYDILVESDSKFSFIERENEISIILENGLELKANDCVESDSAEINKNAFKSMFSDIISQAKSDCDVPENISGIIDEIYKGGVVNWRNVLKRFLTGKGKILSMKTFKRESKRYEGLPGNKRIKGVSALIAIDESGSINSRQSGEFFGEMLNIKRITNADMLVTEFDTDCTQPVPIDKFIKEKKRVKNGGTDFRPVFKLADKMHIPLLIIFTDGDGKAPEDCNQRVLWVLTKGGKKPAGFGETIIFESLEGK